MRSAFSVLSPSHTALRALNYSPEVERFRRLSHSRAATPLRTLISSRGDSYGEVFTRRDCDPSLGVELISQIDAFSSEPSGRVIRRDSMMRPDRHLVKKWQILICGAGQMGESTLFGSSIIADDRLAGKYTGGHLVALTFPEPGSANNLYVYAYLISKPGQRAIRSCAYGTSVPGIRLDLLGELPIPQAPAPIEERVANLIRLTVETRERYVRELHAARSVLEALPEMQYALEQCQARTARCVLWKSELPTLCAWNVASTGGALEYLQTKWNARLGDILTGRGVFRGDRFARVPCIAPHGIPFYSQRDLFLIRSVPRRITQPPVDDDSLFSPEGSLLAGGHGTLGEGEIFGRVVYVSGEMANAAFTEDLLRIRPQQEFAFLAYAFLSTTIGFRLLRSTGVGTKLLSMRPDLLRALPFPDVDKYRCALIENHLKMAMIARQQAESSEKEAVRIIEQEVLPAWLS